MAAEFYVPCLSSYQRYDRAAGYFTSSIFPILAQGLAIFIERGGQMRLVCSPVLSPADAAAISEGYEARQPTVELALVKEIEAAGRRFAESTAVLAWMVAAGTLDIKVAIPSHSKGIYHEKFGLFGDDQGDYVGFTGSPNETYGGVLSNFEQIAVFVVGQEDRESARVQDLRRSFDRLWNNETAALDVVSFPEGARRALIRYRPPQRPQWHVPERPRYELFPHQQQAIDAWIDANQRGILEMATGTGKTITAVAATEQLASEGNLILVLVPGLDLLDQWKAVLKRLIPTASIVAVGGDSAWRRRLSDFVSRWRILSSRRQFGAKAAGHYVVATMDSAATDAFLNRFSGLGDRLVLIVDEAHRAGSDFRRRSLDLPCHKRLGLSATPERAWDSAGQAAVSKGIGDVIFRYGLKEAIRDGYLTPYEYLPYLVTLSDPERHDFAELSDQIQKAFVVLATKYPQAARNLQALLDVAAPGETQRLQLLLFRRADVLKSAASKMAVVHKLAADPAIRSCLVYCNDEDQVEAAVRVLAQQRRSYGVFTTARLQYPQRKVVLRDFSEDRFDFLVAIRCLDEGIDIPGARHAAILASSRTEREFIQRRGRVLRRSPDKERSVIHDPLVVPFSLDVDGFPSSELTEAEQVIVSRELHRADLFVDAAENSVEAMTSLHKIRELIRLASEGIQTTQSESI